MSNAEFMEIITKVLSNFDPLKTEDQDAAVFASTFNHFEKKERKRHRKVVKKVNDNYFVELEKREKDKKNILKFLRSKESDRSLRFLAGVLFDTLFLINGFLMKKVVHCLHF